MLALWLWLVKKSSNGLERGNMILVFLGPPPAFGRGSRCSGLTALRPLCGLGRARGAPPTIARPKAKPLVGPKVEKISLFARAKLA